MKKNQVFKENFREIVPYSVQARTKSFTHKHSDQTRKENRVENKR